MFRIIDPKPDFEIKIKGMGEKIDPNTCLDLSSHVPIGFEAFRCLGAL